MKLAVNSPPPPTRTPLGFVCVTVRNGQNFQTEVLVERSFLAKFAAYQLDSLS